MKFIKLLPYLLYIFFAQNLIAQECYPTIHSGEGTFYDSIAGTSSGNCSIPIAIDDFQYCAMNALDYNNSEACDACIDLQGPNGSIILRVVDQCPECLPGDVDLSPQAFAEIADPVDGRVPISWQYVECPLQSNIEIVFKEGSTKYWTAIQLRNLKHAISSLEYLKDDSAWQNIPRESFNFFIAEDGIESPMTLRATSVLGEEIIIEDTGLQNQTIGIQNNVVVSTTQQFSTPENCTTLSVENNNNTVTVEEGTELVYYPNPVINELFIDSNLPNFWKSKSVSIIDLNGEIVTTINAIENNQIQKIELQTLQSGVYFAIISEGQKVVSSNKFIIQ